MGQEISTSHFTEKDFHEFNLRLRRETDLLNEYINNKVFSNGHGVGGFELEAWLVHDQTYSPSANNKNYLKALNNPLVETELAAFNIEINTPPQKLYGCALKNMHNELMDTWNKCILTAREFNNHVMMIGILPTVRDEELVIGNMSDKKRYRALNDQVMLQRKGQPIYIDIEGNEHLIMTHSDVMLESITTAFQIQFQVDSDVAVRFYNASMVLSAPMISVTANSPYVFNKDLWAESRIPLFEQSVTIKTPHEKTSSKPRRVTFGNKYASHSLVDLFIDNCNNYEILLPILFEEDISQFCHLRLHNGTIWRWNRPLIGFDEQGDPHLRIEHRVIPSGPTMIDTIANATFFFGLIQGMGTMNPPVEERIPFDNIEKNFYESAKYGLNASLHWLDGKYHSVKSLILEELLPLSCQGLEQLGLDSQDINYYLNIISERVNKHQTGTDWQRAFQKKYRCDMKELTRQYLENQMSGEPVHRWVI